MIQKGELHPAISIALSVVLALVILAGLARTTVNQSPDSAPAKLIMKMTGWTPNRSTQER